MRYENTVQWWFDKITETLIPFCIPRLHKTPRDPLAASYDSAQLHLQILRILALTAEHLIKEIADDPNKQVNILEFSAEFEEDISLDWFLDYHLGR